MSEWDAREVGKLKKFEGERVCVSWVFGEEEEERRRRLCVRVRERKEGNFFFKILCGYR